MLHFPRCRGHQRWRSPHGAHPPTFALHALTAATAVLFVVLAVAIWFLSSDAALTRSLHALLGITDPSRAPALQLGPARIRRLSRCMRWLLAATAVLFVVLAVAIWFLSSDAALTRSLHALLGITDPSRAPALQLGPGYRVAGFIAGVAGFIAGTAGAGAARHRACPCDVWRLRARRSADLGHGPSLRGIALLITLFALCSPLVKMLLAAAASSPGARPASRTCSSTSSWKTFCWPGRPAVRAGLGHGRSGARGRREPGFI